MHFMLSVTRFLIRCENCEVRYGQLKHQLREKACTSALNSLEQALTTTQCQPP
jgi:hypothetical protein